MQRRKRTRQTETLAERLQQASDRFRSEARLKPPGMEREILLKRARQADVAAHIDEWLSSPGLRPPR
jgi:hypothetical protein